MWQILMSVMRYSWYVNLINLLCPNTELPYWLNNKTLGKLPITIFICWNWHTKLKPYWTYDMFRSTMLGTLIICSTIWQVWIPWFWHLCSTFIMFLNLSFRNLLFHMVFISFELHKPWEEDKVYVSPFIL